ncbi:peroxidase family protein [Stigmatella aurantiaca]|nr:heme peroxidase family protein [Stigmatella aurantiaca]ADO67855.1 Myeloperoxidase, thyroid peroxidase, cyclooxygenase catalytic domain protein [Stigmatella aurantiaca DW4/3-1]
MPAIHGFLPRNGEGTPLGQYVPSGKFGRLFPSLQPLLPPIAALEELGAAMRDSAPGALRGDNENIPAGFTYLGQFIDHDITFDTTPIQEVLVDPLALHNFRTPALDLDCVYGRGPDDQPYLYRLPPDDALFVIGHTSSATPAGDPKVKTSLPFDLPRGEQGLAIIGDPRNDENLIVAQVHLALMRFHNKVVEGLRAGTVAPPPSATQATVFEQARKLVIWHYQWIVLNDFLRRVTDKDVLDGVRTKGRSFYLPLTDAFIPVEFSAAAYRLGHSMVREAYDYNDVFTFRNTPRKVVPASLDLLFRFSGRSGTSVPIPSDWIIDFQRFFQLSPGNGSGPGLSRRLDPFLVPTLADIPNHGVRPGINLAVANLKRGRSLGLPSGQNVARRMRIEPLKPSQIAQGPDGEVAAKHNLHGETPLWYYILKEAEQRGGGKRLGPVGSRILSEVFVGLLEQDASSFLASNPQWTPTLPSARPGDFTMADLLTFAGDLAPINDPNNLLREAASVRDAQPAAAGP